MNKKLLKNSIRVKFKAKTNTFFYVDVNNNQNSIKQIKRVLIYPCYRLAVEFSIKMVLQKLGYFQMG